MDQYCKKDLCNIMSLIFSTVWWNLKMCMDMYMYISREFDYNFHKPIYEIMSKLSYLHIHIMSKLITLNAIFPPNQSSIIRTF